MVKVDSQDDSGLISKILKKFANNVTVIKIQQTPSIPIRVGYLKKLKRMTTNSTIGVANIKYFKYLNDFFDVRSESYSRKPTLDTLMKSTMRFPFKNINLFLAHISFLNLSKILVQSEKHRDLIEYLSFHARNKDGRPLDTIFDSFWRQRIRNLSIETNYGFLFNHLLLSIENLISLKSLSLFLEEELRIDILNEEKKLLLFQKFRSLEKLESLKINFYFQIRFSPVSWKIFAMICDNSNIVNFSIKISFLRNSLDNTSFEFHDYFSQHTEITSRKKCIKDLELSLLNVDNQALEKWGENLKFKFNNSVLENLQLKVSLKNIESSEDSILFRDFNLFDISRAKRLRLNFMKSKDLSYSFKNSTSLCDILEEVYIESLCLQNIIQLAKGIPWSSLKVFFLKLVEPIPNESILHIIASLKLTTSINNFYLDVQPMGSIDSLELIKIIDFILPIKLCCQNFSIIIRLTKLIHITSELYNKIRQLQNYFSREILLWKLDLRIGEIFLHKYDPYGSVKVILSDGLQDCG